MEYYFNVHLENVSVDKAVSLVEEKLKDVGFGILSTIDMRTTLRDKLNVEFYPYLILQACNPSYAYEALKTEDKIGTLLPCNIIVQEKKPGSIEIAAVNPLASMQAVNNLKLNDIALEVSERLRWMINHLQS
ncbi:DUF302 domain-containing protein [Flavobacteriaceae bacterium M23B6Z8]